MHTLSPNKVCSRQGRDSVSVDNRTRSARPACAPSLAVIVNSSRIITFASLALGAFILTGCFVVLPGTDSLNKDVFARTDQNHVTNEVVIVVGIISGTAYPFTPEGPQPRTSHYKRRYYYSDRHVSRRELPFLRRDDSDYDWDTWDVIAPVEVTNCWVRVEGPYTAHSRDTNSVIITVFTPDRLLYQQKIETLDFPGHELLAFRYRQPSCDL